MFLCWCYHTVLANNLKYKGKRKTSVEKGMRRDLPCCIDSDMLITKRFEGQVYDWYWPPSPSPK